MVAVAKNQHADLYAAMFWDALASDVVGALFLSNFPTALHPFVNLFTLSYCSYVCVI